MLGQLSQGRIGMIRHKTGHIERMQAIHAIPNRGEEQDLDVILSLYDSERNDDIKNTLLSALGRYQNQRAYQKLEQVVLNNAEDEVTWIQSYVSEDQKKTYCIYDAPSPEAIRRTARRNNLPVDSITKVRVLDPYFYR